MSYGPKFIDDAISAARSEAKIQVMLADLMEVKARVNQLRASIEEQRDVIEKAHHAASGLSESDYREIVEDVFDYPSALKFSKEACRE